MRLNRRGSGTNHVPGRVIAMLFVLVAGMGALLRHDAGSKRPNLKVASRQSLAQANPLRALSVYGHLPLAFERNVGQTDPSVKFLARGSDYALFLTGKEAVLALQASSRHSSKSSGLTMSSVHMALVGANTSSEVIGSDKLHSVSNYFIGNNPSRWHSNVPQFARVRYQAVYPGIDLIYYGRQGQLEYDFEVAPGADPKQVALQFDGSDKTTLSPSGDLVLVTASGNVRLQAPRVYQKYGQEEKPVAAKFVFRGKDQIGFELRDYDRSHALVIDPVLTYSTYLGGSGDESCSTITGNTVMPGLANPIPGTPGCPAIAVDLGGNMYIAGSTTSLSTTFPGNPVGGSLHGTANVFVSQFNSTGSALSVTYLGGTDASEVDYPAGIAVDSGLNVIVAGTTDSATFPVSGSPFQASPGVSGTKHIFVTQFSPGAIGHPFTGNPSIPLKYSTYLFGNGIDLASGVAVDTLGNIYVTGTTTSTNFPTTATRLPFTSPGSSEFFFSKLNPNLSGTAGLLYSTYIGGTTTPAGATPVATGGGIAVDSNCNAYVTGGTNYTNLPVVNAYQAAPNGGIDAWLGEFRVPLGSTCSSPNASEYQQNYLTYFGGTGTDIAYGVAVDSGLNAYITGGTNSNAIAAGGIGGFQPILGCATANTTCPVPDAFIAKFAPPSTTGTTPGLVTLNYFTYLGGVGTDVGLAIAVDNNSNAFVTGLTDGNFNIPPTDVPLLNEGSYQGGSYDAFFARILTSSSDTCQTGICPSNTSYLGGGGSDIGTGIAMDNQQNVYMTGETGSGNFPTANPFQANLNGTSDAFVTKLGPVANFTTKVTTSPLQVGIGNAVTFTYTVTNIGDQVSGVVFSDFLSSGGATLVSATASPGGACPTAQNSIVTCSIGNMTTGEVATVIVTVTPKTSGSVTNSGGVTQPVAQPIVNATPATVNDYSITAIPPSTQSVPAGVPATYTLQVTPTGPIPETITLSCGTLPTGVGQNFNNATIANLTSGGAVNRTLVLTTTARTTTSTRLWQNGGPLFATLLPISGLTLLGIGASRKKSCKSYWLMTLALGAFFGLVLLQAGCGGSKSVTTTSGTPAGTYTIVVNATSGSIVRSTTIQLTVQ
ncbi:MAG TPA: SBBP repeat-containing protein [Terriglobales bacterium]|nr:SBBP repeat-containing protein [Terriglobales bacterium]